MALAFPMAATTVFSGAKHALDAFPEAEVHQLEFVGGIGSERLNIDTSGTLPSFALAFLDGGELLEAEGGAVPSRRQTAYRVAIEMHAAGFSLDEATERIGQRLRDPGA